MPETPADRAARLLARSIQIDPPWDGIPACWSWPTKPIPDWDTGLSDAARSAVQQAAGGPETALLSQWQTGRCAICGRTAAGGLVTDHDHRTGLVRGLLCRSCNALEGGDQRPVGMLGRYRERPPVAILGISVRYSDPYTEEYTQPTPDHGDRWEDNPVSGL